jgi:hypothetical protein
MRSLAYVTAAALVTAMLPGPASAATTNDCTAETSTRILTSGLDDADRVWIDRPSETRTLVCVRFQSLSAGGLVVVVDDGGIPTVSLGGDPWRCPFLVFALVDPVGIRLAVDVAHPAVCLTVGNTTLTVGVDPATGALPGVEVWRDGGPDWGWIDVAACPAEYALAVAFGGPTTCMESNERVTETGGGGGGAIGPDGVNTGSEGAVVQVASDGIAERDSHVHDVVSDCAYRVHRPTGVVTVVGKTKAMRHPRASGTAIRCRVETASGIVVFDETRAAADDTARLEAVITNPTTEPLRVCNRGDATWPDGHVRATPFTCV